MQAEIVETTQGAAESAPTIVEPSAADGFGDLVSRVTSGDMSAETWILAWETIGRPVLLAVVLIIAVFIAAGWARKIVGKAVRKGNVEETLARFLSNMARYLVLIAGGVAILGTLGVETASFAAVLAALGFAIGMAMSGMLGNIAAGIMLLFFRPFKVGDVVEAGGVKGKVFEIGLFTTVFDTPDNRRIIVPNNSIFGDNIENVSFHSTRRVTVPVGTAYGADVDKTREVLLQAAKDSQGVLADPAPVVFLKGLGGSSIDWDVRVWVNAADFWDVQDRLTRDVKYALDNADIGIPFPQMELNICGKLEQA